VLPLETLQRQLGQAMPEAAGRGDFMARLSIRTASLAQTSAVLRSAAIPFQHIQPGSILVPARAAGNVGLEFVQGWL